MSIKHKCECPYESFGNVPESMYAPEELSGRVHKKGECKGTHNIKKYLRKGKELWLCSCCCFGSDLEDDE